MRPGKTPFAVAGVLVGAAATGIVLGVIALASGSRFLSGTERPLLDPIPIPVSACPALGSLRVAAEYDGDGWVEALSESRTQWQPFAAQLAPELIGSACGRPLFESPPAEL
jgi:hypothetical protein